MTERRRQFKNPSLRWAFMDIFRLPQYDSEGDVFVRLRIVQTPWFGVYATRFNSPDPRPILHDHSWGFVSFVLRGGYVERRLDPLTREINEHHVVRFVNWVRTHDAHAIVQLKRTPTYTLMFVGPRRRVWGYLEPNVKSWNWTECDLHQTQDEFVAAVARRDR